MECRQWVATDLYNGRIVRVANSFVFKTPVFNYSADFPYLWDEITVPVKYGCDYRLAREIFQRVAKEVVSDTAAHAREDWNGMLSKYRIEAATTEPLVTLQANSNWIELTIRYTVDFKKRRVVKDTLFSRILEEMDKTGGLVAIASTTFAVVETPVIDIRLRRDQ